MIVTVFGCSGFLGRYVVASLARQGNIVITPYRGEQDDIRHLKVCGNQLGTIIQPRFNLNNPNSIDECISESDTVVNLIGRDYDSRSFSMQQINEEGARIIARQCTKQKIKQLIHISTITGKITSSLKNWSYWQRENEFLNSKLKGELAVMQEFSNPTIVRPSIMFGYEDRLWNSTGMFSNYNSIIPIIRPSTAIKYPVHVVDIANAITKLATDKQYWNNGEGVAQIYELVGPNQLSIRDIVELFIKFSMQQDMKTISLSPTLYRLFAFSLREWRQLPMHRVSQIKNLLYDELLTDGKKGFQHLNIEPSSMEKYAIELLRVYRPVSDFKSPNLNKQIQP